MKTLKVNQMKQMRRLEKIILELKSWKEGKSLDPEVEYIVGEVKSNEHRNEKIEFYKNTISAIMKDKPEDNKLYLSEVVRKENTKFESNNLILAPVGSGKTTFINELLNDYSGKALLLVSNTTLKNSISPDNDDVKRERSDRTYTTQNKKVYGDKNYKVHVMSYSEFGKRVRINDDFIKDIKKIFCDEVHSLPNYQGFKDSTNLSHAIKTLFSKYDDKEIYYFTATDEYLKDLERKEPNVFRNVKTFDFRDHPEIKRYVPLSKYKFNHIEQIRPHLKARLESFTYFKYKCLAFSRTIAGQKRIEEIAKEEGFNPIVLWSVNNKDELQMSKEQLAAREHIILHGEIPDPYNILIINSSMQEGWDLFDVGVKLAIMNTISETEKVQAMGRLRDDIDVLVYKVKKDETPYVKITIPDDYLNNPLTTKDKDDLCNKLNIINSNGELSKWRMIRKLILDNDSGYEIKDHTMTIGGKRTRVSTIIYKEDFE